MQIVKTFRFEAAHWLPHFPDGHKCRRLHGHSFEVEVVVAGPVDEHTGVVMDFGELKRVVSPLIDRLDHYCLNELGAQLNDPLLSNPTSENVARWFWRELKPLLPLLDEVIVHETCTSRCMYRG
jgi:6-pyruvoyltetrahydropterin/6-carboxytetrahydropterin synthase